jgi:hypothetical protein
VQSASEPHRVTDADCTGIVDIVRSMKPAP